MIRERQGQSTELGQAWGWGLGVRSENASNAEDLYSGPRMPTWTRAHTIFVAIRNLVTSARADLLLGRQGLRCERKMRKWSL